MSEELIIIKEPQTVEYSYHLCCAYAYSGTGGGGGTSIPQKVRKSNDILRLLKAIRQENPQPKNRKYVASENSDLFHLLSCKWAAMIGEENKVYFRTYLAAIHSGKRPCGGCRPN